jgi:hypothetical protein
MIRCPLCDSGAVVLVVSPNRRAFCTACGGRWIQDGTEQRDVRRPPSFERITPVHDAEERFSVDWA